MSFATTVTRATLRQSARAPTRAARRYESSASKVSSKATSVAAEVQQKASEGLTRVSSGAGGQLSSAAESASNMISKVGGRTGQLIKMVESAIPPTIYYARVGLELAKLVAQGQKMSPPPMATFQSYFQQTIKNIRHPSKFLPESASAEGVAGAAGAARNFSNAQMATVAVVVAECLGFFTVGEMIGRFKLVGYRGEASGENGALNEH